MAAVGNRGTRVPAGDGTAGDRRIGAGRAPGGAPAGRVARRLVGAVMAVSLLGGCGGGGGGAPTAADSAFLSEVHDAAPSINGVRSDVQLERLGHAVCDGFAAGASYRELADRLALQAGSGSLPSVDLGAVIMAAADNYCPQYRSRV